MRVSEYFNLGRTQETLDFVDVDLDTDIPVFLSPKALTELPGDWSQECVYLIQNFFGHIVSLIKAGNHHQARLLLSSLREPNETRLGLSEGRPQGRALGNLSARNVWKALSESEAIKSGLVRDLEDTVLLVYGIRTDIISDMTTNIIRGPLIKYTQHVCNYYEIPIRKDVRSGPVWNAKEKRWVQSFVHLPVARNGKLLLVPKIIVRLGVAYDGSEYYKEYLLERMIEEEEDANSSLVRLIKAGPRRGEYGVTKTDMKEKYGVKKETVIEQTMKYPDVLEAYREDKDNEPFLPLSHQQLADVEATELPDWDALLSNVLSVPPGRPEAPQYENAIESLLSALFYPALTNPTKQDRIHEGRKRIDLTYTNVGFSGFFKWLALHYTCPVLFIECKNYAKDVGNPEIDQLSSRFSPSRGAVGLLVCREFADVKTLIRRCRDTAIDSRGYIIPLQDIDLKELVQERKDNPSELRFALLRKRFDKLIM